MIKKMLKSQKGEITVLLTILSALVMLAGAAAGSYTAKSGRFGLQSATDDACRAIEQDPTHPDYPNTMCDAVLSVNVYTATSCSGANDQRFATDVSLTYPDGNTLTEQSSTMSPAGFSNIDFFPPDNTEAKVEVTFPQTAVVMGTEYNLNPCTLSGQQVNGQKVTRGLTSNDFGNFANKSIDVRAELVQITVTPTPTHSPTPSPTTGHGQGDIQTNISLTDNIEPPGQGGTGGTDSIELILERNPSGASWNQADTFCYNTNVQDGTSFSHTFQNITFDKDHRVSAIPHFGTSCNQPVGSGGLGTEFFVQANCSGGNSSGGKCVFSGPGTANLGITTQDTGTAQSIRGTATINNPGGCNVEEARVCLENLDNEVDPSFCDAEDQYVTNRVASGPHNFLLSVPNVSGSDRINYALIASYTDKNSSSRNLSDPGSPTIPDGPGVITNSSGVKSGGRRADISCANCSGNICSGCNAEITIPETDCAAGTGQPDLEIRDSDITWSPVSPTANDNIRFTVTTRNIGDVSANPSTMSFTIDHDNDGIPEENFNASVPAIDPGASATTTFPSGGQNWNAPAAGTYELQATADITNSVPNEIIEGTDVPTNNRGATTLTVTSDNKPDLTIVPGSFRIDPDPLTVGSSPAFIFDVINRGNVDAGPTDIAARIKVNPQADPATPTLGDFTRPLTSLAAGASTSFNIPASSFTTEATIYDFIVTVDDQKSVNESNETNNTSTITKDLTGVTPGTGTISGQITVTNLSGFNLDSAWVTRCTVGETSPCSGVPVSFASQEGDDSSWFISRSQNNENWLYGYRLVTDSGGNPLNPGDTVVLPSAYAVIGMSPYPSVQQWAQVTIPSSGNATRDFTVVINPPLPPDQAALADGNPACTQADFDILSQNFDQLINIQGTDYLVTSVAISAARACAL